VEGQTNVLIHVVQGERELAKDCRSLARFDLKDIPPMPTGMARVEVRFLIDANGILQVTARDARTGKEHSVEVKPSYGLTDEQVEAMIEASIDHAEEDLQAAQVALARVEADTILAAIDKAKRNDAWGDLADEERRRIGEAIRGLQAVYHADDPHAIREKIDVLNEETHHLAENMMNTAVRSALKGTKI
jgi:molecular chaperone DnaK (HSP70)